jgi:hypothetical protein
MRDFILFYMLGAIMTVIATSDYSSDWRMVAGATWPFEVILAFNRQLGGGQ